MHSILLIYTVLDLALQIQRLLLEYRAHVLFRPVSRAAEGVRSAVRRLRKDSRDVATQHAAQEHMVRVGGRRCVRWIGGWLDA